MARVKLTAGRIRDFTKRPDQRQSFLWDADAPWLAVRASAQAKLYIFQSRLAGASLRLTIGTVTAWDIDQARTEARRLQTLIDQGIDPRQDKAERIAVREAKSTEAHRQDATFAAAFAAYLADRRPQWGERYYVDHLNFARPGGEPKSRGPGLTTPGPLAPLLTLKLADLTPERVRAWLQGEAAHRPTQARQAYGALRTFLAWCEDRPEYRGLAAADAATPRTARQELPKKGAKDDVLQREQLSAWFAAVRQLANPVIAAYLQALLLTGARREELGTLTWEHLDFRWGSMTIRDKIEGERTIPLTPYVASLLAALPRRNAWVFSSPTAAAGRLVEPRIAHNRALTAAGLPDLTLHGLRRSFGTLSEWVEMPTGVVAQIMGHKPSATAEKHYRRRPLDLLRQWHTRLEAWLLTEAGIEQPTAGTAVPGLRCVK
jgi:integrase